MAKLTKTYIDKITPPASGYDLHFDEQDRGFGVRVTKDGKRTYIVQGRVNGKEARISIGPHGVFTADQAREVAREHLRSMRQGIDPRTVAKERAAEAVTLRDVADAYKRDRPLKESSKGEIERHVTTTFEAWLKKPMTSITREAVTKRFNEIKNHGLRGDGPAPAQANQGFSVLRALFNYAIREYRRPDGTAIIKDNPVEVLHKKWAPIKAKTTRIPDSKVGAVWSALQQWREVAYNRDTLRDGGPRQIDRIQRGSVYVPNWGASVLAACTPDGIAKQMKNMPEDGLIQRFVPCIMGTPDLDADGDCTAEIKLWEQCIRWAHQFTSIPRHPVRLSPEAREMFEWERKEQRKLTMATEGFAPAYAAHLGKHPGMLAEIALTFHVFAGRGEPGPEIDAHTMGTAILYMRRVRRHAYYLYSAT